MAKGPNQCFSHVFSMSWIPSPPDHAKSVHIELISHTSGVDLRIRRPVSGPCGWVKCVQCDAARARTREYIFSTIYNLMLCFFHATCFHHYQPFLLSVYETNFPFKMLFHHHSSLKGLITIYLFKRKTMQILGAYATGRLRRLG